MTIPKYPYQVIVDYSVGNGKTTRKTKSFEFLPSACQYALSSKREARTRRVQITMILEELSGNGETHC